jgi:hypothetical protein
MDPRRGALVMMSEPEKNLGRWWKAILSEPDRARVDAALALDPELERDLEAMLEGLSPKRREPFMRRFSANLMEADNPQDALVLAIADIRSGRTSQ